MVKKMKLPSLLLSKSWPSCHQPRTLSFRTQNDAAFKTINPAYLDTASELDSSIPDSLETVIRGLRSDRLFFHPDQTSSILEAKTGTTTATATTTTTTTSSSSSSLPFKDSVVMSVDSQDPYVDFRRSMEEMLEAQCVKDWEGLQELLCWYLKVNGKSNHGYIVGAFVDLLVSSSSSSSSSSFSSSLSPSSPLSFYSSSLSSSCSTRCVSCLEAEVEVDIPTITPTSSFLLEQVREDHASSSSSSSSSSFN